jgi:uncharacterized membrane protein
MLVKDSLLSLFKLSTIIICSTEEKYSLNAFAIGPLSFVIILLIFNDWGSSLWFLYPVTFIIIDYVVFILLFDFRVTLS